MFTNELRAIMSARTDDGEPSRAFTAADTRRPSTAAVSRAARRWGGPRSRLAGGPAGLPTDAPTTVHRIYARGGGVILQQR